MTIKSHMPIAWEKATSPENLEPLKMGSRTKTTKLRLPIDTPDQKMKRRVKLNKQRNLRLRPIHTGEVHKILTKKKAAIDSVKRE